MPATTSKIRLFVVDDHVPAHFDAVLPGDHPVEVIGRSTVLDPVALDQLGRQRCDVVVLKHVVPGNGMIETIRSLRAAHPHIGVVVLATRQTEHDLERTLQAGANSYLVHDGTSPLLSVAIRAACRGASVVPSEMLWRKPVVPRGGRAAAASGARKVSLTAREQQVLRLLAQGYSNKELSSRLGLAVATIKKHIQSIIAKLGVSSRTEAALRAVREKLVD